MSAPPVLDRPLVLETPTRLADGAGGFALTWSALGTIWAALQPGSGREAAGEETLTSRVAYRITVRGAPDGSPRRPRAEQRFRDGARLFTILAVTERDPRGQYLTCFAQEERPT